jgi:hypothetical protein
MKLLHLLSLALILSSPLALPTARAGSATASDPGEQVFIKVPGVKGDATEKTHLGWTTFFQFRYAMPDQGTPTLDITIADGPSAQALITQLKANGTTDTVVVDDFGLVSTTFKGVTVLKVENGKAQGSTPMLILHLGAASFVEKPVTPG